MNERVALTAHDLVAVFGDNTYAIVGSGSATEAQLVTNDAGVFYRSGMKADVPMASINGAFHQDEVFAARHLNGFV